jgi:hypothetical protein
MAPTPSEPRPPVLATAAAISGDDTPAIGAWMMGTSIPSRSSSREDESVGMAYESHGDEAEAKPVDRRGLFISICARRCVGKCATQAGTHAGYQERCLVIHFAPEAVCAGPASAKIHRAVRPSGDNRHPLIGQWYIHHAHDTGRQGNVHRAEPRIIEAAAKALLGVLG